MLLLGACGGEGDPGGDGAVGDPAGTVAESPRNAAPTSAEVPEGGLERWVVEMRARLEEIELDPRASHPETLSLYTTYHGAVERYYGEGGVFTAGDHPELARAVAAQDTAFQELLALTGTTDYIERTHLLHAIRNVRLELARVLSEAREADVPLER